MGRVKLYKDPNAKYKDKPEWFVEIMKATEFKKEPEKPIYTKHDIKRVKIALEKYGFSNDAYDSVKDIMYFKIFNKIVNKYFSVYKQNNNF